MIKKIQGQFKEPENGVKLETWNDILISHPEISRGKLKDFMKSINEPLTSYTVYDLSGDIGDDQYYEDKNIIPDMKITSYIKDLQGHIVITSSVHRYLDKDHSLRNLIFKNKK